MQQKITVEQWINGGLAAVGFGSIGLALYYAFLAAAMQAKWSLGIGQAIFAVIGIVGEALVIDRAAMFWKEGQLGKFSRSLAMWLVCASLAFLTDFAGFYSAQDATANQRLTESTKFQTRKTKSAGLAADLAQLRADRKNLPTAVNGHAVRPVAALESDKNFINSNGCQGPTTAAQRGHCAELGIAKKAEELDGQISAKQAQADQADEKLENVQAFTSDKDPMVEGFSRLFGLDKDADLKFAVFRALALSAFVSGIWFTRGMRTHLEAAPVGAPIPLHSTDSSHHEVHVHIPSLGNASSGTVEHKTFNQWLDPATGKHLIGKP